MNDQFYMGICWLQDCYHGFWVLDCFLFLSLAFFGVSPVTGSSFLFVRFHFKIPAINIHVYEMLFIYFHLKYGTLTGIYIIPLYTEIMQVFSSMLNVLRSKITE